MMNENDCIAMAAQSALPGATAGVVGGSAAAMPPVFNRILVTGTLTCASPLHIGCGRGLDEEASRRLAVDMAVETDYTGRPVVPGSALKGVLRHRLMESLPGKSGVAVCEALLGRAVAGDGGEHRGSGPSKIDLGAQRPKAGNRAGKIDVSDAACVTPPNAAAIWHPAASPHWDSARGTYVAQSVSLTDEGVAASHLLYNLELVPDGTKFHVELWCRNLADEELAALLWAFDGFNDPVRPVTVGGLSGRGCGRMTWAGLEVRRLGTAYALLQNEDEREVEAGGQKPSAKLTRTLLEASRPWRVVAAEDPGTLLSTAEHDDVARLADEFEGLSRELRSGRGEDDAKAKASDVVVGVEIVLESDLVVRSYPSLDDGADFELYLGDDDEYQTGHSAKRRGLSANTALRRPGEKIRAEAHGHAPKTGQVGALAWQVWLDESGAPHAEFRMPGSSLRGAFRAVCRRDMPGLVDGLFGTTNSKGRLAVADLSFTSDALEAGRGAAPGPATILYEGSAVAGGSADAGAQFVIKERSPVDRLTGGVKAGGLHRFLAVRRGSRLSGALRIRECAQEDLRALALWRDMLNQGLVTLGGAGAEGDGKVRMTLKLLPEAGKLPEAPASLLGEATDLSTFGSTDTATRWDGAAAAETGLTSESREAYAMNPYDFVCFPRLNEGGLIPPRLRTSKEWEGLADGGEAGLLSGSIEVELEVLQPLFVAGRFVEPAGGGGYWQFHRAPDGPAIPGASLRGMLRSYVEAAWNGWVSTYSRNDASGHPYAKSRGARYVGFNSDADQQDYAGPQQDQPKPLMPKALPEEYVPRANKVETDGIDLATFLFGAVLEPEGSTTGEGGADPEGVAVRSRVVVSDSRVDSDDLDATTYWYPDVKGDALLGGAAPSKSSMMYFDLGHVVSRHIDVEGRNGFDIAQFYAGPFRGRKFYFHQDWRRCVESYRDSKSRVNFWAAAQGDRGAVLQRHVEAVRPGASVRFEVSFRRLPEQCVRLLIEALAPSSGVRHKLGGLKPFGFGSVRLRPSGLRLYRVTDGRLSRYAEREAGIQSAQAAAASGPVPDAWMRADEWDWACDTTAFVYNDYLLRYLLTYPDNMETSPIFCYPAYRQDAGASALVRGFAVPNAARVLTNNEHIEDIYPRRQATIEDVAAYFNLPEANTNRKITQHLGLLQRRSRFFPAVCHRALRGDEELTDVTFFVHWDARF